MSRRKDLLGWIHLVTRASPRGWSLVILPQEIRIDTFHGRLHIHPPGERGAPVPIAERPLDELGDLVRHHAERRGTIVFKDLREELR